MKKKIDKNKGIFFRISGLPGSGKTRIGKKLLPKIIKLYGPTVMWSGDDFRRIFQNRKYDLKGRNEFGRMVINFLSLTNSQSINIIFATVGLNNEIRRYFKKNIKNYIEIFIDADLKMLKKMNVRKFYNNGSKNVWGNDIKPEFPKNPDIKIRNNFTKKIDFLATKILKKIENIINQ